VVLRCGVGSFRSRRSIWPIAGDGGLRAPNPAGKSRLERAGWKDPAGKIRLERSGWKEAADQKRAATKTILNTASEPLVNLRYFGPDTHSNLPISKNQGG
jgi:hypothetical protein